jgi:alkyldihydroxyacetonephosphate synthase
MLDICLIGESFETSVPWDKCEQLCVNTKARIAAECLKRKINGYIMSCRVTQTYDSGACVYFYFAYQTLGIEHPLEVYEEIETAAREEIFASGGTISHHHGIGKIRSRWYKQSVSDVGVQLYKSTKKELDPNNVFAAGNILPPDEKIDFSSPASKL